MLGKSFHFCYKSRRKLRKDLLKIFESCKTEDIIISRKYSDIKIRSFVRTTNKKRNTIKSVGSSNFKYILNDGHAFKKFIRDSNKDIKGDGVNSFEFGKIHFRTGNRP